MNARGMYFHSGVYGHVPYLRVPFSTKKSGNGYGSEGKIPGQLKFAQRNSGNSQKLLEILIVERFV